MESRRNPVLNRRGLIATAFVRVSRASVDPGIECPTDCKSAVVIGSDDFGTFGIAAGILGTAAHDIRRHLASLLHADHPRVAA